MTREEAIERLEDTFEGWNMWVMDNDSPASKMSKALSMAIAALREQDVTDINVGNKWISVEERLPEKDKDVLCYSNKNGGHLFFGYRGYISGEWMEGGSLHIGDVTHWMPLPEPPEVEV